MIVGEGGNREGHSEFLNQEAEEWVAVCDNKVYGFGTLEVVNASHAFWRWIANGEDDGFSDEYWFRNHYYEDLVGKEYIRHWLYYQNTITANIITTNISKLNKNNVTSVPPTISHN